MADLKNRLRGLVLSASEVKSLTGWPDAMVEDYINILESLITISDAVDETAEQTTITSPVSFSLISDLNKRVGSGNFLTSDETGFTVDTTLLTVDMTEA